MTIGESVAGYLRTSRRFLILLIMKVLLAKLKNYGIRGNVLNLLTSYFHFISFLHL